MRILVVGSNGQLGRDLVPTLRARGHEVTALDRQALDVSDEAAVAEAVTSSAAERVVNCAAYTKVDQAESEPKRAYAVNRDGARNLAQACARVGVAFCHLSTDFVFTQDPPEPRHPWAETDLPRPRGVYAESKRAGELECMAAGGPLFLVRTSWLYGGRGPNFPLAICRAAAAGVRLKVVADQEGTPTWTGHLAPALSRLLEQESFGLYHLSGSGSTTWLHFAKSILAEVGIAATVEATTTAEWGAPAPRPRYSVLDNLNWRQLGLAPLPAWEEGLLQYVGAEREGAFAEFAASHPSTP
ncbi:MAG TPA: dTDP-4-dehydrorhamnose reductase [Candidatus Saccharimonadales bacterium]|nr:dTDP-4-dehydrorhamnose reductase [Candidatus Saccharimonadales bacterium]